MKENNIIHYYVFIHFDFTVQHYTSLQLFNVNRKILIMYQDHDRPKENFAIYIYYNKHYIYVIQQDIRCFMIKFIHNIWWLDMFRTTIIHLQERLQAVCCKFGMFFLQQQNIWTYRVVGKIPHTKFATYSLKTLLKMDYCGPKHVEPPNVMNKLNHKTLCILLDFIYIARLIHDPYNIKLNMTDLWIIFRLKRISVLFAMFKPDVHFDIPYGSPATEFFYHLFIKAELKIMFSFHNILHNVYNRPVISFT